MSSFELTGWKIFDYSGVASNIAAADGCYAGTRFDEALRWRKGE
ncbi:hypothetical protein [Burkholderia sp. MSHR3999]|nr:hypothetical protein [Burkholderia sp. MSHR3999]